jgi:hypothetical protein
LTSARRIVYACGNNLHLTLTIDVNASADRAGMRASHTRLMASLHLHQIVSTPRPARQRSINMLSPEPSAGRMRERDLNQRYNLSLTWKILLTRKGLQRYYEHTFYANCVPRIPTR